MRLKLWIALLSGLLLVCLVRWTSAEGSPWHYPTTPQIPTIETFHGVEVEDPYQWLEDGKDPKVQQWTEAQNAFTTSYLSTLPHQKELERKLNALSRYDDREVVETIEGTRKFLWTKKADQERWVLSVQENPTDAPILLLDPNTWSSQETLEFATPSRDGAYVAFGKAQSGNETATIYILNVATKQLLPDTLTGTKQGWPSGSVSWLPHNAGFLFSANPKKGEVAEGEENYWNAVYFHKLGTHADADVKIFGDVQNKDTFHQGDVSEDGRTVMLTRSRMSSVTQVYMKSVNDLLAAPQPIVESMDALYGVMAIDDKLLIMTDQNAPQGKVYITDIKSPTPENWKELIPTSEDSLININAIGGHLYVEYLHNAHSLIKIYSLSGQYLRDLPLPPLSSATVDGFWRKPEVWIDTTSFINPPAKYDYNFHSNSLKLDFTPNIPFDSSPYIVEQVWYTSKDQTPVSMFLIHRKDLVKNGQQRVLLTGYGGFNYAITPLFSEFIATYLETGGMVAIPNLRGGGEYGRQWHEGGMRANKQHVFDDFIAAAEWLISQGYTHSQKLAIRGGSNGGLLVGAALTQRPDLFGSVVCEVPLLDMLRYHRFGFASIWADEYGHADDPDYFPILKQYSPYHSVKEGIDYPPTLFVAAENDTRVDPFHAKKMTAILQTTNPQNGPFLLWVTKEAGHAGGTTQTANIEHRARILSFLTR